ncbi:MAG: winged helix-turn-helix transcriptional regulator [Actinobacteria bacterium]|nr:winged helix-turn-helix transcriptional regulator [Actinomycetota bacterium]
MADDANETLSIIERAKADAKARVKELEPLVKEHTELTEFLARVSGKAPAAPAPAPAPSSGPKPATRGEIDAQLEGSNKGSGKKRRNRKGGTTGDKALAIVQENPGISASEVAEKLKIKPNYLYRVMADLTGDGKVTKDGRNYTAV